MYLNVCVAICVFFFTPFTLNLPTPFINQPPSAMKQQQPSVGSGSGGPLAFPARALDMSAVKGAPPPPAAAALSEGMAQLVASANAVAGTVMGGMGSDSVVVVVVRWVGRDL